MKRTSIYTAAAIVLLASVLPIGSVRADRNAGGFQPYKDAKAGFALSKPDGWTVRSEALNIWVETPDKSELVLTRAFTPDVGQSAVDWLQTLGTQYDKDFPQAALDHAQHVQTVTTGDEIIADAHYQGPKGPAKMRILCRIVNGKGWLYAFAAPADRYRAEQPKMLQVAQSIAFFAPKAKGAGKSSGSNGGGGGTMTAAQMKAVEKSLHFTKWLEPTEHAYTISIPQGWKVTSTMHRSGGPMPNFFYAISSPGEDIGIMKGLPDMISFVELNRMNAQMGMQEGQNGIMHYMHAPEFNEFFLRKVLKDAFSELTIDSSQEDEKAGKQIAAQMANQYTQNEASAGMTTFKATEAKTGKKIEGVLITMTNRTKMNGSDLVTWFALPQMITIKTGDAQTDTRRTKSIIAYLRLNSSFLMTPDWFAKENAEALADSKAKGDAMIENSRRTSSAIAANSRETSDRLMSNFRNHEAAVDEGHRGFMNYLSSSTDVVDGAGHTAHVASGASSYYRNDRTGTVVGTNSAYSPGVDFTPMKEY